jgi:hypothetical protein
MPAANCKSANFYKYCTTVFNYEQILVSALHAVFERRKGTVCICGFGKLKSAHKRLGLQIKSPKGPVRLEKCEVAHWREEKFILVVGDTRVEAKAHS